MKYIAGVVICIIAIITMTSCKSVPKEMGVNEYSKEVLRCFDEEDSEGLKALFCAEIQNTHNLDKEIAEAMEFFEGKVISYDDNFNGRSGQSVDDGEVTEKHFVPIIDDITTDSGVTYKITFYYYKVNTKDENRVGINNIVIRNKDTDTRYIIGDSD